MSRRAKKSISGQAQVEGGSPGPAGGFELVRHSGRARLDYSRAAMASRTRIGLFGRAAAAPTLMPAMLQRDRTARRQKSQDGAAVRCSALVRRGGGTASNGRAGGRPGNSRMQRAGGGRGVLLGNWPRAHETTQRLGGGARLHTASEDQVGVSECPLAVKSEENYSRRGRAIRVESVQRSTELGRHPGRIHVQRERGGEGTAATTFCCGRVNECSRGRGHGRALHGRTTVPRAWRAHSGLGRDTRTQRAAVGLDVWCDATTAGCGREQQHRVVAKGCGL
jgi:hypothetical protein